MGTSAGGTVPIRVDHTSRPCATKRDPFADRIAKRLEGGKQGRNPIDVRKNDAQRIEMPG
jgi:hypothetical protein